MTRRRGAACFAASVTASAMATAGFSWLPVLLGWCAGGAAAWLLSPGDGGAPRLRLAWSMILMAAVLLGADGAFPEEGTFPFLSVALLLILWRATRGAELSRTAAAACLGLLLLPILGTVALFGLGDVRWPENRPLAPNQAEFWAQLWIAAAVTCPWWLTSRDRRGSPLWFLGAAALSVSFSLLTNGILGAALTAREAFPLYQTVQTIRVLGVLQRMEAFLAAAVMLGAFAILLLAAEQASGALEQLGAPRWVNAPVLGAAFLLEWAARSLPDAPAELARGVFWGFLPATALWIVVSPKIAKKA